LRLLYGTSLVCLTDMDYDESQPVLQSKNNYLFIIGATSPKLWCYRRWCKQNGLSLVVMDIPRADEIE
jgi:hypothetical protein